MHQQPVPNSVQKFADYQIDLVDGALYYIPKWLSETRAAHLFEILQHELEWQQGTVRVFGNWHRIPRLQAWYGDPSAIYGYSGKPLIPLPWHNELLQLRDDFGAKTFLECQNCGAPLEESNGECKYCGMKHLRDTISNWVVTDVKQK